MQPTISVEEFQRFQSQLLDLREAQIQATDARLRAESKAKQLEAELAELKSTLNHVQISTHQNRVDQLLRDNAQLRDKLLGTESAFQLQSSTLRAECLHLSSEVDRLKELLNRPRNDRCTQVEPSRVHILVQTETEIPRTICSPPPCLSQEKLEAIKDVEDRIDALAGNLNSRIESKLHELESRLHTEVRTLQTRITSFEVNESNLKLELAAAQQSAMQAHESEQEVRNQLVAVKQRSEKLTRELRRQLTRVIRGTGVVEADRGSLRKLSIYSSSSSLSSATHVPGVVGSVVNGERKPPRQTPTDAADDSSNGGQFDVPAGFFPVADFKALVDRLSEVQEENCSLRRRLQRLEIDLAAKTRALQIEMSNRLACSDSSSTKHGSSVLPKHTTSNSTASSSTARGMNNLFNPISSMFSSILKNHPDPTTLSSANLDTVNRLKHLCENLLTENMRLSAELEAIRK